MSQQLPPELWMEILEIVPQSDLPAVHAISSLFTELSYSRLLSEFAFHPRPQPLYLRTSRHRRASAGVLDFRQNWSPCAHARLAVRIYDADAIIVSSPSKLAADCLDHVSSFTNLQDLICRALTLDIGALCVSAPSLRFIDGVQIVRALCRLGAPGRALCIHTNTVCASGNEPTPRYTFSMRRFSPVSTLGRDRRMTSGTFWKHP
ncbi:hypothetical protein B0H14DRAFT_3499768 [Mycena olivaceomarginata]|nr:hypothetical protein B0H14DRAFT_3499768 [Mycena olivaceomarginata]